MITTIVLISWGIAATAICWANHRARLAATPVPPPPDDPDSTADDWDDVALLPAAVYPPPVPLPEVWTESDEAMLAWYCAGQADR